MQTTAATVAPGDPQSRWQLIRTPVGEPWSGRARYAAAMDFYQAGTMDAATLEVYRICARLDHENPLDVLRRWQTGDDWIARLQREGR